MAVDWTCLLNPRSMANPVTTADNLIRRLGHMGPYCVAMLEDDSIISLDPNSLNTTIRSKAITFGGKEAWSVKAIASDLVSYTWPAPRPTPITPRLPLIAWTLIPRIFNANPNVFSGMSVNVTGYNAYTERMRQQVSSLKSHNSHHAIGPQEWSITREMYVQKADEAVARGCTFLEIDEYVHTTAPLYRVKIMSDGLRAAKQKHPQLKLFLFAVLGLGPEVIDLVRDGVVDYLGAEMYTVTHPQFQVPGRPLEERMVLLDQCRAAGILGATIPMIGHLTAGPVYWGQPFTPESVINTMRRIRSLYPECPGIGYWVPHLEVDSPANRQVIRAFAEEARRQFPSAITS
jgi:hypothetical protein